MHDRQVRIFSKNKCDWSVPLFKISANLNQGDNFRLLFQFHLLVFINVNISVIECIIRQIYLLLQMLLATPCV